MIQAIREMKQAGLSNKEIAWEIAGAVSVFAIPISLMFLSEMF